MFDEKKGAADKNSRYLRSALSAGYEIRIQGNLDRYWLDWFDGWELTNLENGEVLLSRSQVDLSALHGALNKIRDLNLTLISVSKISTKNDPL